MSTGRPLCVEGNINRDVRHREERAIAERLRRANALFADFMEGQRTFIPALPNEPSRFMKS